MWSFTLATRQREHCVEQESVKTEVDDEESSSFYSGWSKAISVAPAVAPGYGWSESKKLQLPGFHGNVDAGQAKRTAEREMD